MRSEAGRPALAAAVWAVVGVFLAWTCLPGVHWHDTGEFMATTWWWSLSHPPSHPVHAMASRPAMWLPMGDLAFRANLASGLWLAVALAQLPGLLRGWGVRAPAGALALLAVAPALWPALWLQGARAEVYALQLALTLAVLRLATALHRGRDPRHFVAAAFTLGLAAANHSLLAVALVPAVALSGLGARVRPRAWLFGAAAGLTGLLAYAYLPLRAAKGLDVGWGNPTDLARFVDTVLARDWQKNLISEGTTGLDLGGNAAAIVEYGLEQVGLGAVVLGLGFCAALPGAVRRRGTTGLLGAAMVALPVLATRFFYPFDAENPDMGGYLAPALLVALMCAAWAMADAPRLVWWLLAVAPFARLDFDPGGRQGSRAAESGLRRLVDEVPPGAALVLAEYGTWFQTWWLRAIMAERPDLTTVYRGRLGQAWALERLARVDAFGAAGAPSARWRAFPVGFDPSDAWFESGVERARLGPLERRLAPAGLLWRAAPPAGLELVAAAWSRRAGLPPDRLDRDTRLAYAFQLAVAADTLLARPDGDPALGLVPAFLERARAFIPGSQDSMLDDLDARWRQRAASRPQGL